MALKTHEVQHLECFVNLSSLSLFNPGRVQVSGLPERTLGREDVAESHWRSSPLA